MRWDLLLVALHLFTAVFLVGYGLFWAITASAHPERKDRARLAGFLGRLRSARWPPFGVPPGLRLPLPALGWAAIAVLVATGVGNYAQLGVESHAVFGVKMLLALGLVAAQAVLSLRPSPGACHALGVLAPATVLASAPLVAPGFRGVVLAVHLAAVVLWLGHMFFWSLVVGPVVKRYPEDERETLRAASHRWGALGGSALLVLFLTGGILLLERGGEPPAPFYAKLVLVGGMLLYQVLVGHRRAPRLIYANMLAALAVIALSVYTVHGA